MIIRISHIFFSFYCQSTHTLFLKNHSYNHTLFLWLYNNNNNEILIDVIDFLNFFFWGTRLPKMDQVRAERNY